MTVGADAKFVKSNHNSIGLPHTYIYVIVTIELNHDVGLIIYVCLSEGTDI